MIINFFSVENNHVSILTRHAIQVRAHHPVPDPEEEPDEKPQEIPPPEDPSPEPIQEPPQPDIPVRA
jgi:hypothetical protein